MMADIVERLRTAAKFGGHYAEAANEITVLRAEANEAADEIERLRTVLERITTENVRTNMTAIRPEDQLRHIARTALNQTAPTKSVGDSAGAGVER